MYACTLTLLEWLECLHPISPSLPIFFFFKIHTLAQQPAARTRIMPRFEDTDKFKQTKTATNPEKQKELEEQRKGV